MRSVIIAGILVLLLGPCAQAWAATAEDVAKLRTQATASFNEGQRRAGSAAMREALNAAEALWGKTDARTDEIAYDLARMYTAVNDPRAVEIYERLECSLAERNPDDPRLAIVHYGIAESLMNRGPHRSLEEFDTALKLMKAQGFDTKEHANELYIRALYQSAFVHLATFDVQEARKLYSRAIAKSKALFGNDSTPHAEALFAQAQYSVSTGEGHRGAREYEQALAIMRKHLPEDDPHVLRIHASLVSVYESLKESDKATDHLMILAEKTPDKDGALVPFYKVVAQYPLAARANGEEGSVVLKFRVTTDGHVDDISVIKGEAGSPLVGAAIKAVKQWRYKPRFVDGKPVATDTTTQITFQLTDKTPTKR